MSEYHLLTIKVVYGELDFGKTGYCESFIIDQGNRQRLVDQLRWLADACENGNPPFWPLDGRYTPTEGEQEAA